MDASTVARPRAVDMPGPAGMDLAAVRQLFRTLAASALVLSAATGLLICVRRSSGWLAQPPTLTALFAVGCVLATVAWSFRGAFFPARVELPVARLLTASFAALAAIWLAALAMPAVQPWGWMALVGPLALGESWWWGRRSNVPREPTADDRALAPAIRFSIVSDAIEEEVETEPRFTPEPVYAADHESTDHERADDESEDDELSDDGPANDESIVQQLVRRREGTGETIEGWVRIEFAAAQRHAAAHIAICPPMQRVPRCFAEQNDGPAGQVKIAQVLPQGVRIELRLDQPANEATTSTIEFAIQDLDEESS